MSKRTFNLLQQNYQGTSVIPICVTDDDSDEHRIELLEAENQNLKTSLEYEKKLRITAEKRVVELEDMLGKVKIRKRRTNDELANAEIKEYSEIKTNGIKKAAPAEPIRSYDDFLALQNYFLSKNNIRDWTLWTVGVGLGLRISDLFRIKMKYILMPDNKTFRQRLKVYEQKTSKMNDCLLTEGITNAISKYLDSINWEFKPEDYLFSSKKTGGKMRTECGWRIISDAGKALKLPLNIGSHTMRKTFANIAACVDKSSIDMNSITKVQGLLNHTDQQCTMRYLGTYREMYDRARIAVSDFIMGKTEINELIAGNSCSMYEIMLKLDTLETKLFDKQET